ncbi:MAG TPA: response regulator transcription factor [Dermatophilaceae bacterium]|nr:response regulator transcription factor [Dermatophilaceae bacterium]
MITILLVDDHQLVRAGLRALLESVDDLRVVGEAGDGDAAVDLAVAERPDVVLMDLSMPRVDGVEATRRLAAAGVDTRVVVLTSFADQPRVQAALAAGAVGYLLKDSDPRDVISAVRQAAAGHVPIDARVAQALLPGSQTPAAGHTLSGREAEVLSLVAQGMANKQIARQLGISERTVKAHLGKVFRQIGVADRTSAALWAREHLGTSGVGVS